CGGAKDATPAAAGPTQAQPQAKPPIKIAVVTSRSGAFEAWGTHEIRGLQIGLEYATGGTMAVNGRKIELKEFDDQGKTDTGKAVAEQAITEWKADIIQGTVSSGVATQIIPVIDQYKKIFMVEPAAADNITTKDFASICSARARTRPRTPSPVR
ncbi:MAG: transporter permease, partial [Firmicutes bacterium]|nr:transporter permease [Bacillota bacterium]